MLVPKRHTNNSDYRYGFNGKEKDDELKGKGNSYDFGARMYDPRVGRWFAPDPLERYFPEYSTYNFTLNNPIFYIDPDGKAPTSDPVKKITSSESTGNVTPISVKKENFCLICGAQKTIVPTSLLSSVGTTVEKSQLQDDHPFLYTFLTEGGTTEHIHSVTTKTTTIETQYFDKKGNPLPSIKNATSLRINTKVTETTVKVGIDLVDKNATVLETSNSVTYNVSRKPNSKLQRGYELQNPVMKDNGVKLSTVNFKKISKEIQSQAKKASMDNFMSYMKDAIDQAKKLHESQDEHFWKTLKKS